MAQPLRTMSELRHFRGVPPLAGLVMLEFNRSRSGDGLMNRDVFTLFGVVAALLTATLALTLSRAAPLPSGIGTLKCYDVDVAGAIEKPCDRQPLVVRTSARNAGLD
jgi:hypothetical protein